MQKGIAKGKYCVKEIYIFFNYHIRGRNVAQWEALGLIPSMAIKQKTEIEKHKRTMVSSEKLCLIDKMFIKYICV